MKIESYKNIIEKGFISNELELEKVSIIERKLRILEAEDQNYRKDRQLLREIIGKYESENWNLLSEINTDKLEESDLAEKIADIERSFFAKRKVIIKGKLKEYNINQQELGLILEHSKSYISELINGINPFSIKDLIIIHKLFHIDLEDLLPTTINPNDSIRIKDSILKLNKNQKLLNELVYS